MTLQLLGECVEGLERRPRGEGQTFMQVGKIKMEVGAVVEDRSEAGEPDGATKIAGQIEEAEAFFTRSGGSVQSATSLIGIIAVINPTPRKICGQTSSQKSQSLVR
jgi:hypothetical protein